MAKLSNATVSQLAFIYQPRRAFANETRQHRFRSIENVLREQVVLATGSAIDAYPLPVGLWQNQSAIIKG
jgi:hypothetical protein